MRLGGGAYTHIVGPSRCACRWVSARPRAVRAASFARRVVLMPSWFRRLRVPRVGAAGEVARWFETIVAFACLCLCGTETIVAFACLCLCGTETVIAFAGGKWVFLVHFLGAEVMAVSVVLCWG